MFADRQQKAPLSRKLYKIDVIMNKSLSYNLLIETVFFDIISME